MQLADYQQKEWLVVVNPNAGIGKAGRDWGKISGLLEKHGFAYQAVFTERPLHACELVLENMAAGYRNFIAVGGDGTINEVVNGVFGQTKWPTTGVTVGMISVGTGNDWIRTYNIPTNYEQSILILKQGETMLQDVGIVRYYNNNRQHSRFFVNVAGLGFDGLVAKKTNADKIRGRGNPFLYLVNLIGSLFSYKSCQTTMIIDGNELTDKVFSIGVGIGKYNGGGMQQTPDAKTDDGLFDLTMIKDLSKWSVITNVRRLYDGTIKKHKRVESFLGKNIRIECESPLLLEADGESLGHAPFAFEIIPRSLRVVINTNKGDST